MAVRAGIFIVGVFDQKVFGDHVTDYQVKVALHLFFSLVTQSRTILDCKTLSIGH